MVNREAAAGPEVDHVGLERDEHLACAGAGEGAIGALLPCLLIVPGDALVVGRGGVSALARLDQEAVGLIVILLVRVLGPLGLGRLAEEGDDYWMTTAHS